MCAFYHHPPPLAAAGDPYPYTAAPFTDPYHAAAIAPASPIQPYSHPYHAHSYHLQPPVPINPISIPLNYSLPSPPRQDDVKTLFVAGLPEDTKPREIYNLFREFPGYESSSLRINEKTSQPYAFAVFSDRNSALTAMHALNGVRFDLERETILHIDFAKSNSRGKRSRGDDDVANPSQQKTKYFKGEESFGYGSKNYTFGHSVHSTSAFPSTRVSSLEPQPSAIDYNQMSASNPPCPTLFVNNLSPNCLEDELIQVFSRWPGFLKLKMQRRRDSFVAFVDFNDENSATEAMNNLQGTFLRSSSNAGMHLEYAKTRMGLRSKHDRNRKFGLENK